MVTQLRKFNFRRQQRGMATFQVGLGLNTGKVISGNIGSEKRMEYQAHFGRRQAGNESAMAPAAHRASVFHAEQRAEIRGSGSGKRRKKKHHYEFVRR